MNELKTVSKLVKAILEDDKRCRNSDSYLYMKVLEYIDCRDNTHIRHMPVDEFLQVMHILDVPSFETVRRTRQKVQADFPELAACDKVKGLRMVNETEFRQFARGNVL